MYRWVGRFTEKCADQHLAYLLPESWMPMLGTMRFVFSTPHCLTRRGSPLASAALSLRQLDFLPALLRCCLSFTCAAISISSVVCRLGRECPDLALIGSQTSGDRRCGALWHFDECSIRCQDLGLQCQEPATALVAGAKAAATSGKVPSPSANSPRSFRQLLAAVLGPSDAPQTKFRGRFDNSAQCRSGQWKLLDARPEFS